MLGNITRSIRLLLLLVVSIMLVGVGCSKAPREAQGMLDTPLHHYEIGMRFVDSGDLEAAMRSFNTALELNAVYGPAISGKGLVLAMKGDAKDFLDIIRTGQAKADDAETSPERMWTFVAEQRAYIALHRLGKISDDSLIYESGRAFNKAQDAAEGLKNGSAMPWYWQGEAYLRALDFESSRTYFREAQKIDQGLGKKAAEKLIMLERIINASLKTSIGKRIALVERISRADMAALLVEELGVEKFFDGTDAPEASTFEGPADGNAGNDAQAESPEGESALGVAPIIDIQNHPLAQDIQEILTHRLRGLQPFADHTFQPNKSLTRAEVALILEDIFIRAKNDAGLATRFVGQVSPFPDVRNDHPYFNAVMFSATRGLLSASLSKGLFRPFDTVSGVDAVLMINAIKTELDVF